MPSRGVGPFGFIRPNTGGAMNTPEFVDGVLVYLPPAQLRVERLLKSIPE